MHESNPFESIALEKVMDRCRRRERKTFLVRAVSTESVMNRTSDTAYSRLRFESKNPINVPKLNGLVYPRTFNSLRDETLKSVG